jgi:hypothetical protein
MIHRARRVHLATGPTGLTVCGLVARALGARGTWRYSWQDTPPSWRCARCRRRLEAWRATRAMPPLAWAD